MTAAAPNPGTLEHAQSMPCYGPALGYLHWHADADRRDKRGERQVYCGLCNIWAWPANVAPEHREHTVTSERFHADAAQMEAQLKAERRVAEQAVARFRKRKASP